MVEYWKVEDPVFSGIGFNKEIKHLLAICFHLKRNFANNPIYTIFPKPIIPSFHYSTILPLQAG
jgi:hypothetical protein